MRPLRVLCGVEERRRGLGVGSWNGSYLLFVGNLQIPIIKSIFYLCCGSGPSGLNGQWHASIVETATPVTCYLSQKGSRCRRPTAPQGIPLVSLNKSHSVFSFQQAGLIIGPSSRICHKSNSHTKNHLRLERLLSGFERLRLLVANDTSVSLNSRSSPQKSQRLSHCRLHEAICTS